jgi:hypothetical protein
MTSRGNISRQLSQIASVIHAQGLTFEDVMPGEMRVHFRDMVALQEARAYIKEIEGREAELQASNADLLSQLAAKQAVIDDQPGEFKALKVDLQQSQRHIDYYKGIANHQEARADRCQRKMEEACKASSIAAADAGKIERLECDLAERQITVHKLLQENCAMRDTHESEHEKTLELIEEKDAIIVALTDRINQIEAEQLMAHEDSDEFNDTCYSLIDDIEQEVTTAAEVVNFKSIKLFELRESHDQLCSAVASELAPLIRLYDHVYGIMEAFREIFRCLSNPHTRAVPRIPQSLDGMLDAANDQLYAYQRVSDEIHTQPLVQKYSLAQQAVVHQVDDIAKAAAHTCTGLEDFKEDISSFLDRLRNGPDTWLTIDARLGSASSRSRISIMSLTKRFSTGSASAMTP